MAGDGVVDAGGDAMLVGEGPGEAVAVVGDPDGVLVVDVDSAVGHWGYDDAAEVRVEEFRVLLPLLGPAGQLRQLRPADGGVYVGHPRVEPDYLVFVPALHALVAQQPDRAGQPGIGAGHHAAFTRGHVHGPLQAEQAEHAEGADRPALPCGAVGLRGIFIDR